MQTANVVRSTNFRGDGVLDFGDVVQLPIELRQFTERALSEGDIVIERSGGGPKQPVGRVAHFVPPDEETYFTSNFTTVLRVVDRARFDPGFVALYLHALYLSGATEALQRATTGIRNLDWQEYLRFEVPEFPLAEQCALAKLISEVRRRYRLELGQFTNTQLTKQATMATLFTRGLRGEAQKETEIGLMPTSWEPKSVLSLCEIWSGGTPRKSVAEHWTGNIPWVSGKDLKLPTLDDAIDHITPEGVAAGSRLVPAGSVLLLVRGMGLAKDLPVAVISRPMAFNQDVKALVSRGAYSGGFLRAAIYAGKDRLLSQIVPSAHGTMTLNLNDVECFQVACPSSPEEANEIVNVLNALDEKIKLHKQKHAVLEELFKALLHQLMTGEIDVNDLDLTALSAI
ncbi:MAG: restriction endonuclease subunit S [Paucibacter sp.]|nr:restriction endonuclease subunit S [Roseateles sp.]